MALLRVVAFIIADFLPIVKTAGDCIQWERSCHKIKEAMKRSRRVASQKNIMTKQCLITTMSMTLAMKGKGILERSNIRATVSRLPPNLTTSGCAYGIAIDCTQIRRAKESLERAGFSYGKMVNADGSPVRWDGRESVPAITGTPRTTVPKGGEGR